MTNAEPNPVDLATYNPASHALLAGVEAPLVAYAPGGHLHPAPVNLNPPEMEVPAVEPELELEPAPEPAAPIAVREPAPEPVQDGRMAREYPPRQIPEERF